MSVPLPAKLKVPAFGKNLIYNCRRGFLPLHVDVLYGDDWREAFTRRDLEKKVFVRDGLSARPYEDRWLKEVGAPMLALRPREFAPGLFDFRCVVGSMVRVFDLEWGLADYDQDDAGDVVRWGLFYDLIAEIAVYAAGITVHAAVGAAAVMDMARYAQELRDRAMFAGRAAWPRWWSDEIEGNRGKREFYWLGDAGYHAERSAQRVA
jgi:hypothetical protein